MTRQTALIVDDEPDICELLEMTLAQMNVDTRAAMTIADAHQLLDKHNFDLCLTDMRLPDGNGIDLVRHIQQTHSQIPTAVITAHGNMESAVEALKAGAFDFVSKPVDLKILRKLVGTALRLGEQHSEPTLTLTGNSRGIERVRGLITKLARSQAPVYISGESGVGKELVARMIHEQGPRAGGPFVPVNCGAIPGELMESEFFGHRKGSFTGAVADKTGLFQAADGGTLFLDEVAELPLHMQVKLLRAIQEKSVRPVGEQKELGVDVRILSATHKDLAAQVKDGSFRQDLFYRINVIELKVPPLRERSEDIPLLSDLMLRRLATESGESPAQLSSEAQRALLRYTFPGNVRELENTLERAITLCEGGVIDIDDLFLPEHELAENAILAEIDSTDGEAIQLEPYMDKVEKEIILKTLEQTRWNKTAAAKKLGITFRALRYRLKKLGLE
ncbi:MAG: sigma-54-dependent Fis family transcriptional regulator [Proteobacteria bacterium]|nr:MAG: sigma-54-dependent Fis family transcriptional regulator [Pseudomonadota bacterium]